MGSFNGVSFCFFSLNPTPPTRLTVKSMASRWWKSRQEALEGHRVMLLKSGAADVSVWFVPHSLFIFLKHWIIISSPYKWPLASHCCQDNVLWLKAAQPVWPDAGSVHHCRAPLLSLLLKLDPLSEPLSSQCPLSNPRGTFAFLPSWLIFPISDAFHPHSLILHSFSQCLLVMQYRPGTRFQGCTFYSNPSHPSSSVSSISFLYWERWPESLPPLISQNPA